MWLVTLHPQSESGERQRLTPRFLLFLLSESLAQELMQPIFIVIVKKFVSMVIVNPIRFTVKTNHVGSLQPNWHLCHQVLHVWKGGSRSIILVVVKADHTVPCELLFSSR